MFSLAYEKSFSGDANAPVPLGFFGRDLSSRDAIADGPDFPFHLNLVFFCPEMRQCLPVSRRAGRRELGIFFERTFPP